MTEQAPGHPMSVEIRTPGPLPVTALASLTSLAQGVADQVGAGTLFWGEHFLQDGDDFVFSFAGHAPAFVDDDQQENPDEPSIVTWTRKDPIR